MPFNEGGGEKAVRDVFAEFIPRSEIATRLSPEQRVYVAVAIMLALRNLYLREDNVVLGPLNHALDGLLKTDVEAPQERRAGYAAICKRLGLYAPLPRRTTLQPMRLTPTPTLAALVAELGATGPVHAFHDAAVAATAREKVRIAKARAAYETERDELIAEADRMIEYITAQGGDRLMRAVVRRIDGLLGTRRRKPRT